MPRTPAQRRIPHAEPIDPDVDLEPHRLMAPEQVRAELETLAADGTTLTAYPQGLHTFYLCRVRSLDAQPRPMALEALSTQAPANARTLFVATRPDARIQFALDTEWSADDGHQSCLRAELPVELVRLQQRAFERFEAPLGQSYSAEFALDGQRRQLRISDLSLGGVGLHGSPHEVRSLRVGTRLRRAHLELTQGQALLADLEVQVRRPFRSYLLGEQVHVGCRFVEMPASLRTALERAIDVLRR